MQNLLTSILQGKNYKTYPEELRNFALNLHFYSPSAYSFLNENFGGLLPGLSTLRGYLQHYNLQPGISMEALQSAKRLMAEGKRNGKDIVFNLTCDEMAIRQKVEWDGNAKKMVDYVDYGSSQIPLDDKSRSTLASNAMVFMLVALNSHFKIALSYYLVKSSDGADKEVLLKEVLNACFENGIDILNLTFDGISSNITMVENFGAKLRHSTSEVFFNYTSSGKTRKIQVTLDSCHALKLVRNTVAKHNITDPVGNVISFNHIKALQQLEEREQLHAATKLRGKHIYFQNEVMKVNLAAQTLSSSVAKALDFCRIDLALEQFKDSAATSTFCQNVNDAFDILNSRNIFSKCPGKHAITRQNLEEKEKKVNELVDYFKSLQINGTNILKTKQHTGFFGLITGMQNSIAISRELFQTFESFNFVLTFKFSQDHLETFFSCIRRLGGCNNNPTVRQFRGVYRKLLAHVSISGAVTGNCMPCNDTVLDKVDVNSSNSMNKGAQTNTDNQAISIDPLELQTIFDLLAEVDTTAYIDDVVAYISGSVVKLIKKKFNVTFVPSNWKWSKMGISRCRFLNCNDANVTEN